MLRIPTCPPTEVGSTIRPFERFDGAQWYELETPSQTITVTSAGRSLLVGNRAVMGLLEQYATDLQTNSHTGGNGTRKFLAEGGNARVYTLGDAPYVVKEKRPGSEDELLPSLFRMDHIMDAVERHCPRWIDLPKHYAVCVPIEDPTHQYMLIDKVDSGVTVGDIRGAGREPREPHIEEAMYRSFGPITEDFKTLITAQHQIMREFVEAALETEGLDPKKYLTDFVNPHNTLIEPLETPVGGSDFRFSIIDQ